jgi:hypothetical protein
MIQVPFRFRVALLALWLPAFAGCGTSPPSPQQSALSDLQQLTPVQEVFDDEGTCEI